MLIIRMLECFKVGRSEGRGKDHNSILSNLKTIPQNHYPLSIINYTLKKVVPLPPVFLNV